jgi:hypothetical protein
VGALPACPPVVAVSMNSSTPLQVLTNNKQESVTAGTTRDTGRTAAGNWSWGSPRASRNTAWVTPDECLAATTDWQSSKGPAPLRIAMRGLPSFGGWDPAGFGHAYRTTEPNTALCHAPLTGYHHWKDGFLIGSFERCVECLRIIRNL